MTDGEILKLLEQRDERAIGALNERFGGLLKSLIGNILKDERDVEECLNSVLLRLWSGIPPAKPENLTAYAAKAARNEALMRYRFLKKRHEVLTPAEELRGIIPPAENEVLAKELAEKINAFLGGLPAEKRRVFIRRYWFADSISAIAKSYGMSEGKVTSMLFRLRKSLRDYLGREGLIDE